MKLIQPKAELLIQSSGLEGVYKQIELAGRTCYRSEDKITDGSAGPFVDRMIKSQHYAMLEHGTVYLCSTSDRDENFKILAYSPYAKTAQDEMGWTYTTTNLRALIELFPTTWHGFLSMYMCDPTEYHEKRYTFRLTTSIGVTRELNRHRVHSIAEQSTRYCNYSKNKFGGNITFIQPSWNYVKNAIYNGVPEFDGDYFEDALEEAERAYLKMIKLGWQPQQAREVLPLCTATEIIHTAFASDWKKLFELRLFEKTGKVHPNMLQLAQLMKAEAEKHDIWDDIMQQPSKFD